MSLILSRSGRSNSRWGGCASTLVVVLLASLGTAQDRPAVPTEDHPAVAPTPPPDPGGVNRSLLKFVEDDAPIRNRSESRDEANAYEYLFDYARKVPLDALKKAGRRDIGFVHLFGDERYKYRGELVHIEGNLGRLIRSDPPEALAADGVTDFFEAWVFPEGHHGPPFCVIFAERPANLPLSERFEKPPWVACDAYFFKRYKYQTADGWRMAPLLMARTLTAKPGGPPPAADLWDIPGTVIPLTIAIIAASMAAAVAAAWWFRREDREARARLRRLRPGALGPPTELKLPGDEADPPLW